MDNQLTTLIDQVELEMTTDDEDRVYQSDRLIDEYNNASEEAKRVVDEIFICLCGWRLSTLLEQRKEANNGSTYTAE